MEKVVFCPGTWALYLVLSEKEIEKLDLSKCEKMKEEGFSFNNEFRVWILSKERGEKIRSLVLNGKNFATKSLINASISSFVDECNWIIDIPKYCYLRNDSVITFVGVKDSEEFFKLINEFDTKIFCEDPILFVEIMNKGQEESKEPFGSFDYLKRYECKRL